MDKWRTRSRQLPPSGKCAVRLSTSSAQLRPGSPRGRTAASAWASRGGARAEGDDLGEGIWGSQDYLMLTPRFFRRFGGGGGGIWGPRTT